MNRSVLCAALAAALFLSAGASAATFTYHGNLQDAGKPAEGSYDIELTLYSAAEGGKVVAGPLTMYKVDVHDGTFNTQAPFAALTNVPQQAWLGVRLRKAGAGEFANLGERAPVGADVTATNTGCPGSWSLDGNAGNLSGSYIGTADAQDVVVKAGGFESAKFPAGRQSAYLAGGHTVNNPSYAFAGGFNGAVDHGGSFVWGDDNEGLSSIHDSAANQFVVLATGGAGINTSHGPYGTEPLGGTELTVASTGGDGHQTWLDMLSRSSSASNYRGFGFASAPDGKFYLNALTVNGSGTVRTPMIQVQAGAAGGVGINEAPTSNLSIGLTPGDPSQSVAVRLDGIKSWDLGVASDGSFFLLNDTDVTFPLQSYVNGGDGIEISNLTVDGNAYKPGGGSWAATSDRRIKQDIAPIENAIDTLLKLRPVSFRYTPEYRALEHNLPDKPYLGFIAQEFADVFPEAVSSTGRRVPGAPEGDPSILALDSTPALITTVAAVQELATENADLRKQLDALASRLSKLESAQGN